MAKRWTEAEDEYLIRFYPQYGHAACAKKLPGRSAYSVQYRAARLGLQFGDIKGYISLADLASESGVPIEKLWRSAKDAGALYYPCKTQRKVLVKITWADEYVTKKLEQDHNERMGGLTLKQTAERLGVKPTALQMALKHKTGYLAPFIEKMTVRKGRGRRWLFDAEEVEWVRLQLVEYRARVKRLKTSKQYWIEKYPDVPYSTAVSRIKARHRTLTAVKGGIMRLFVDEAA